MFNVGGLWNINQLHPTGDPVEAVNLFHPKNI